MNITIIAAMDKNHLIGAKGRLPWHLPADLARFKALTWGKPLIMGRKTHESIGKVLPSRDHLIITRTKNISTERCIFFSSITLALKQIKNEKEVMVIGGQSVFEAALPLANKMYLTQIHHSFEGDTYFPKFSNEWIETDRQDFHEKLSYSFITLKKSF